MNTLPCPFHSALAHRKWLEDHARVDGPHFPSGQGEAPSTASVVVAFEGIAGLTGLPVLDATGDRRSNGHLARVTWAQVLAAHGIDVHKFRILARHTSDAILRFVAEAPLPTLRADLGQPDDAAVQSGVSKVLASRFKGLDDTLANLDSRLAKCEQRLSLRMSTSSSSSSTYLAQPVEVDKLILTKFSHDVHRVRSKRRTLQYVGGTTRDYY